MNRKMKQSVPRVCALLLTIFVLSGCATPGDDSERANRAVDDGNAEVEAGKKLSEEGLAKYMEAFDFEESTGSSSDWEDRKQPAREAIDLLGKAVERFRKAADKFEEASKLRVDEKFKQYLSLKTQGLRKRAEQVEVVRNIPEMLLDESIKDSKSLLPKIDEANERSQRLGKESEELESQAEKIRLENAHLFTS